MTAEQTAGVAVALAGIVARLDFRRAMIAESWLGPLSVRSARGGEVHPEMNQQNGGSISVGFWYLYTSGVGLSFRRN